MSLESVKNGVIETITNNPLAAVAVAAGTGLVVGSAAGAVVGAVTAKSSKRKTKKTKKGHSRDRLFKSKQKHERKYKRKRKYKIYGKKGYINPKKSKSKRRGTIHYAKKTGQPYIILASGQAKFIKGKRRKK